MSVSSSVECARHTPSSEANLSSKIHRKVVCAVLGVCPLLSSVECARYTPSSEADLSSKNRRKVVRVVWVVSAPGHDTGLLLQHAASPASAGSGCSFSDECDTSPTETLRNFHLTGSRYLLQLADCSLLPTYNSRTAVSMYEERAARRSSSATLARTGAMNEIICSTLASSSGIPRERI